MLENPQKSELWSKPEILKLQQLPGVEVFDTDSGAFGGQVDGKPIIKTFRIMTDFPNLAEALQRRLSQHERDGCVPVQGSMTHKSQEYPKDMCRAILEHLRCHVQQEQPSRFCTPSQVMAVQLPTQDLSQWDEVADYVERSFQRANQRPYTITPDTTLGKKIQDLFRLDASRIQVVPTPTTRRIPPNLEDYYTRVAFLIYNDSTRAVEVEDLGDLRFPRQKFTKPVRFAVFAYGHRRQQEEPSSSTTAQSGPTMVPNLATDIDFPGLSTSVPSEARSAVARLHLNMGHPSRQELCRLLAYQGDIPDHVYECARRLRCATCERLKPPQQPRPTAQPRLQVGQFGDELQMDVFYCRTLRSETFMVLGMVDRATGFQQAIILPDRNAETAFRCLEQIWLRPYGLPLHLTCDPDTTFRGQFQERLQALGCTVEHCPPEAHHIIGMIERRNALLRTLLEKLIDEFAANTVDDCSMLLTAACHAINSGIHTHGRSAYQAVFGRQPRLLGSNFSDPNTLASSPQVADLQQESPSYKAELVRCEALKSLRELDCSQHLRRALLRKTRGTRIPELQPGQRCAFWRWTKRGSKKRGSWVMGRFLSWDPSHVGKQAWIRSGATTVLVTSEQLRAAFGFEDWVPSKEDITALKNAAEKFGELQDDRGQPPPQGQIPDDDDVLPIQDEGFDSMPFTPSMMVPATPVQQPQTPSSLPHQPSSSQQLQPSPQPPPTLPPQITQQHQQTVHFNIDSPTNITQQVVQQQYHRYGDTTPATPRRGRSRTPTSKRTGALSKIQQTSEQRTEFISPLWSKTLNRNKLFLSMTSSMNDMHYQTCNVNNTLYQTQLNQQYHQQFHSMAPFWIASSSRQTNRSSNHSQQQHQHLIHHNNKHLVNHCSRQRWILERSNSHRRGPLNPWSSS